MRNMKEIWKDVPGYEGIYKASNLGKIKSIDRLVNYNNGKTHIHYGKMLKTKNHKFGYLCLSLCKDGVERYFSVHRIIANTFIENPNGYSHVLHKNDIPYDNRADNLEWGSQKHNIEQAAKKGRMASGDNHYMKKIPIGSMPTSRITLDTNTGIYYDSVKEAAIAKGYDIKWLHCHLRGLETGKVKKIKTSLILA